MKKWRELMVSGWKRGTFLEATLLLMALLSIFTILAIVGYQVAGLLAFMFLGSMLTFLLMHIGWRGQ